MVVDSLWISLWSDVVSLCCISVFIGLMMFLLVGVELFCVVGDGLWISLWVSGCCGCGGGYLYYFVYVLCSVFSCCSCVVVFVVLFCVF